VARDLPRPRPRWKARWYGVAARNLEDKDNAHIRWSDVTVAPAHRRNGLGRALYRKVIESCEGQGEDVIFIGETSDRLPSGEAFGLAIAATPGLPMKINQLDLRSVDRMKVGEWARQAPRGYRLERVDGTVPEPLVKAYIEAAAASTTCPAATSHSTTEPHRAQIRQRESWFKQAGMTCGCFSRSTSAPVRASGSRRSSSTPSITRHPAGRHRGRCGHRGHNIGLWLKA